MQLTLEDYLEGKKLRDTGMEIAASACPTWLDRARSAARHLAMQDGETCCESVYGIVGLPPTPNAAGSIFKGKEWHCIGFRQAVRSSRHAGTIRRWALVGAQ